VVQVSPGASNNGTFSISSVGGDILIYFYDSQGNNIQGNFYFTVYRL
jgi:hypothetical protein